MGTFEKSKKILKVPSTNRRVQEAHINANKEELQISRKSEPQSGLFDCFQAVTSDLAG